MVFNFFSKQVGGTEEYKICDAITSGRITKPLVSWCIGTCGTMFTSEVFSFFSLFQTFDDSSDISALSHLNVFRVVLLKSLIYLL